MAEQATRSRSRQTGFTLIEVLGAVAVMGISYVLLATSAIQSLRFIGESQRRIDASLIADEELAEIELSVELGQLVDLRDEEFEQDPFVVRIEILDMSELYVADAGGNSPDLIDYLATEAAGPFAEYRNSNWLLGYLREVHISVRWQENADEIEVTRTAFIYDQQAWMEAEGKKIDEQDPASRTEAQTSDAAQADADRGDAQ